MSQAMRAEPLPCTTDCQVDDSHTQPKKSKGHAQRQGSVLSSTCTQLRHARHDGGSSELKHHQTCLQGLLGVIKAQHADDADTDGSIAAACYLQQWLQTSAQVIAGQQVCGGKLPNYSKGPMNWCNACVLQAISSAAEVGTARKLGQYRRQPGCCRR